MKKLAVFFFIMSLVLVFAHCRKANEFPDSQYDERLSGGSQTVFDATAKAFSHQFKNLTSYDSKIHELGDAGFEQTFVTAPAPINSGLGGVYNNVSCISCHHNDGIGVPTAGESQSSLLIRISEPGSNEHGGPKPVPGYGTQVQDKAIFGKQPEAKVNIVYSYQTYTFSDGTSYELRTPTYSLTDLYAPINGNYITSPRLAPPVFGLGLLGAVPEAEILSKVDEQDANGDGISGKANYVWDQTYHKMMLGRFGWKANVATINSQVAGAYNADMGITNSVFPTETDAGQLQDDGLQDDPELADSTLHAVVFYAQTLQVPARRDVTDPKVLRGKQIFMDAGCAGCHEPTLTTGVDVAFPQLSNQRIHPYTDLLLHDMGGGLADHRPDYEASGTEWRTAPLWGLGLYARVNYPAYYLHDGRARTLTEAIMWHGGEAQSAKEYVQGLSASDRDALLAFLGSL